MPERIPMARDGADVELVRQAGCHAVPSPAPPGTRELFRLQGGTLVVVEGAPAARPAAPEARPVFRVGADGPLAVPTGRIHVRLAAGARLIEHEADLRAAGFEIVSVPTYAPQSGYVQAVEGGVARALAGLARLRALPGVEAAEPELLTPAARR